VTEQVTPQGLVVPPAGIPRPRPEIGGAAPIPALERMRAGRRFGRKWSPRPLG